MRVAHVTTGRSLVLRGSPGADIAVGADQIWAFHLVAEGPDRCRLIERGKTAHGGSLTDRLFFSTLLVEPVGFVMSREMLRGIRERAERAGA